MAFASRKKPSPLWVRLLVFLVLYMGVVSIVVPPLAQLGGRVPLPVQGRGPLRPHAQWMTWLNRHYVTPQLKDQLIEVAESMHQLSPELHVVYLDANFPFFDGFPLLPHLSHDDGKKVDLAFFYKKDGKVSNRKPSVSGYGYFVEPLPNEYNQTRACKERGYWQYDYTRYLTLGSRNDLVFDASHTRSLIRQIVRDHRTQILLVEPHLVKRMRLDHPKIRFQGCHAVRHDDHLHYQIK